jgi:hypothetical protein
VGRGQNRDPDRPSTAAYAEFADAIKRAQAEFEVQCLLRISAAAKANPKHWRASAWLLERLSPERYGGRRFAAVARRIAAEKVEALLVAAIEALEHWVPPSQRRSEVANLIARAERIVGGTLRPDDGDPTGW